MDTQTEYNQTLMQDCGHLVRQAGKVLSAYQSKFTVAQMKDTVDLATTADLAAEKYIVSFLRKKYPDHSIFSEEAGPINPGHEYEWIIDPLDGTKEYSRGYTEYNCLVAVEKKGNVIAGAMQRNGVNDMYVGAQGLGATFNALRTRVSTQTDLSKSFIGFHVPKKGQNDTMIRKGIEQLYRLITHTYRVRPGWDDAKAAGMLARGVLDGLVVCPDIIKWHDIAPLIIIVTEAGGTVTDMHGRPLQNHDISDGIVISNTLLHTDLLTVINGVE